MISNLKLKFGRTSDAVATEIPATAITVFVGPNNSGKSKILSEIERYCRHGHADVSAVLVEEISFHGLDAAEAKKAIEHIRLAPQLNEAVAVGNVVVGRGGSRQQVPLDDLTRYVINPNESLNAFCGWFLRHITLILDGRSRINLVNDQSAGDLQQAPQSSFQVLLRDDTKRREVRRIVYDAFGKYFVLDPTNLGQLRVRMSDVPPSSEMEERGIHAEAVDFHSRAMSIQEASDGVKAFTGIVTEIIAGDPQVVLIDEPEAFLHPSLSSKLGLEISRAALAADKRVFVSTHSPTFVMGCIQSGAPVNIVRLTYRGGVATARILPSQDLLRIMRHPLLRSTNVLSGLFYEFVVITESDADRAFYQEINERLLEFSPDRGIPNCLFINAQNKQTVQTIIKPLRHLGIPAAAIVDIDVLKEGGANWANLLRGANVPEASHEGLATSRATIKRLIEETGRDMKRDGGLAVLDAASCEAGQNLLSHLAKYGIFIVPRGEVESWLKELGVEGHGPTWLIGMFERMGHDSSSDTFVKPAEDDVWDFIGAIKRWLVDPSRLGIPG